EPTTLALGDVSIVVASEFRFLAGGRVQISRRLLESSDPSAEIEFAEVHRGCWGTTEYPEDMRGVRLAAVAAGREEALTYAYEARSLRVKNPERVLAELPQVRTRIA